MSELMELLTAKKLPADYIRALEADGCTLAVLEEIWYDAEYTPHQMQPVEWNPGHHAVYQRVKGVPAAEHVYPWRVANAVSESCCECEYVAS